MSLEANVLCVCNCIYLLLIRYFNSLSGYEISEHDLVAMARLRGEHLKEFHIPTSCIHWIDEDNLEVVGNVEPEFAEMVFIEYFFSVIE